MDSTPPYAATALALTVQEWEQLGLGNDAETCATTDLSVLVERVTSLLLIRLVALHSKSDNYSTSNICRTALMTQEPWPEAITDAVIQQLRNYVHAILSQYKNVPYHNVSHAYHVVLSANKMVDLMLSHTGVKTFGLKQDPIAQLSLVFAALIHDVEHQGIPNRQLALENNELAILYNDESIAENRSLYIGFSELLKDQYRELREAMFAGGEDYRHFRKHVVNLVLNTDIASSERTQIGKSKWKEAFGEPFETIEAKARRRASLNSRNLSEAEEEEESSSGTPDSSFHGESDHDGVIRSGITLSSVHSLDAGDVGGSSTPSKSFQRVPSYSPHSTGSGGSEASDTKFQRRLSPHSLPPGDVKGFRKRLGIRRSMDLSGELLDSYSKSTRTLLSSLDEPDELKATVVLETIMTAADVAHNLQGWDHMVKWSGRLYMELRKAYVEGRGFDPQTKWFENQIGFLESYLLPLAHRLEDTGVFGRDMGPLFARIVESNRDTWWTEGEAVTAKIVAEGAETFPNPSTN